MKKKAKAQPRMLSYVLEAVKNLKEPRGSTERNIINQICNVKNKSRNVMTQIKKAIRHALESGALTVRGGKYKLTIDTKVNVKTRRTRRRRPRFGGRRRRSRSGKRMNIHRRRSHRTKYSASTASRTTSPSVSSRSGTSDSNTSKSSITARSIRRRRRSRAKRNIHVMKRMQRNRGASKIFQQKQTTPIPADNKMQNDEEFPTDNHIMDNIGNTDINTAAQQDTDNCWAENSETPRSLDVMSPECDDLECLCNVKQEPNDEDEDDDMHGHLYSI